MIRAIGRAIRARPATFAGVMAAVFLMYIVLPVGLLSTVRKPVDFFTFNPWLARFPEWIASGAVPLQKKLDFLPGLVLFQFSADSPFGGPEWGYAVDVSDLVRFVLMAALFGAYFALWFYRRDQLRRALRRPRLDGRHGGTAGALASVLGFSTGPCSVVGCGAPVLPVVGLALTGLSSGTLKLLADVSRIGSALVLGATVAGVAYLAWRASRDGAELSPG